MLNFLQVSLRLHFTIISKKKKEYFYSGIYRLSSILTLILYRLVNSERFCRGFLYADSDDLLQFNFKMKVNSSTCAADRPAITPDHGPLKIIPPQSPVISNTSS